MADSIPFRRRLGVRAWLAVAFATVGVGTAVLVYSIISGSSEEAATERSSDIAIGRTVRLADKLGIAPRDDANAILASARNVNYAAWSFDRKRHLTSPDMVLGQDLSDVPGAQRAKRLAFRGRRYAKELPNNITVASAPVFRLGRVDGAVLARASRPEEVRSALEAVREDRLTALAIAVGIAVLTAAAIASLITVRVKRMAAAAAQIAEGHLDTPLHPRGRDEIGDLGRALEAMRVELRESFGLLSQERDTLSAILDALGEAVIVVSEQGEIRFSNPAAKPLIGPDRKVLDTLRPWLTRAVQRGEASSDAMRVGDRVYALQARELTGEAGVLVVVRDRTEELRRELAEREFVSNAAHELRNPIAGISGAIEVLRAGAKDDPEARDHFLSRLAEDAERISRLTHSLLTLARIEAVADAEAEMVDVAAAAEEAAQAVIAPADLRLELDVEPGLWAQGDAVLLRQVLISLLTNAYKNTPPDGAVTLRARNHGEKDVLIEVSDTGTGIPPDERERVFERFFRGSNALEKEGFGLGLSIAHRMVEVMRGEIGVVSELGMGSTFTVRLPAAKPAPTPLA
jgi:signal transduction histidine kinase/HAMP domain-containing protein